MHQPHPGHRAGAILRALDTTTTGSTPRGGGNTCECAPTDRSLRAEVRNLLLRLRAAERIRALPPSTRLEPAALLLELSRDARECARRSWRQNKAPMALYWKAVSVYAGHLHRVVRPSKAATARLEGV